MQLRPLHASAGLVLLVLGFVAAGRPLASAEVYPAGIDVVRGEPGRLPPRPAEVTRLSDLGDAPGSPEDSDAGLVITPAVALLEVEPGRAVQPRLTVTNTSSTALDLDLATRPVTIDDDGAPRLAPAEGGSGAIPSAAEWVALAEDHLHLEPQEQASLWPTIVRPARPDPTWGAAALTVATEDVRVRSLLVVGPPTGGVRDVDVRVDAGDGSGSVTVISLTSGPDSAAVASGSLSLRSWYGTDVLRADLPATVVLPGTTRIQTVEFAGPAIPGPHTAKVRITSGEEAASVIATHRVWLGPPLALLAGVAALLVVATLALLVLVVRRRRARRGSSAE